LRQEATDTVYRIVHPHPPSISRVLSLFGGTAAPRALFINLLETAKRTSLAIADQQQGTISHPDLVLRTGKEKRMPDEEMYDNDTNIR